jgi:hypothetical protein
MPNESKRTVWVALVAGSGARAGELVTRAATTLAKVTTWGDRSGPCGSGRSAAQRGDAPLNSDQSLT